MTELFGIIAAVLTTGSFLPQAIKIIREKETAGISLAMYMMFSLGITSWLIYGIMLHSYPIILANSVTLILSCIILAVKIKIG